MMSIHITFIPSTDVNVTCKSTLARLGRYAWWPFQECTPVTSRCRVHSNGMGRGIGPDVFTSLSQKTGFILCILLIETAVLSTLLWYCGFVELLSLNLPPRLV